MYDPFGEPAGTAGTSSRLGFQGDWTDPDSGQVWMGARWYDPAAAQFTSRDTVMGELTTPVRLNRYTYASNSPLAYYDPDGRLDSAVTNGNDTPRDTAAAAAVITGRRPVPAAHREDREQLNNPRTRQREQRRRARVAMPAVSFLEEQADHYRDEGWDDDASAMGGLIDAIIDAFIRDGRIDSSLDPFEWDEWLTDYGADMSRYDWGSQEIRVAQLEVYDQITTAAEREADSDRWNGFMSWIPVFGIPAAYADAKDAYGEGDTARAVANIAGIIPLGKAAKLLRGADEAADVLGAASRGADDLVDLTSEARRNHILYGDVSGGGHLWPGEAGKTPFPQNWSGDRIIHEISDVATDPAAARVEYGTRVVVTGTRSGVDIRVIVENGTEIITGYPTNLPRNP